MFMSESRACLLPELLCDLDMTQRVKVDHRQIKGSQHANGLMMSSVIKRRSHKNNLGLRLEEATSLYYSLFSVVFAVSQVQTDWCFFWLCQKLHVEEVGISGASCKCVMSYTTNMLC